MKLTWKYRKVENVKLLSSKIRCDREKLERALMNKTVGFKKTSSCQRCQFPSTIERQIPGENYDGTLQNYDGTSTKRFLT